MNNYNGDEDDDGDEEDEDEEGGDEDEDVADEAEDNSFAKENKIFAQIHYIPVHLMPYYKDLGCKEGDSPLSEMYYQHCISLPMYPTLTDEEQNYVIELINRYYV